MSEEDRSEDEAADEGGEDGFGAADRAAVALLLIDVINDLEFEGAEALMRYIPELAGCAADLKQRAKRAGIPVVYVNDNYGRWRSDRERLVERSARPGARGRELVEALRPEEDDYFVIKPRHSGFFSTNLEVLLGQMGARSLILVGVAGNICVLFTANDAYMRGYRLYVPSDCCASNEAEDNDRALALMREVLKADTRPSDRLDLERIVREAPE